MLSLMLALPDVLRELLGRHKVVATYGWAAKIHDDLRWKPMNDDTASLKVLVQNSIDQRIVIPGESDLIIEVPDGRIEIKCCHECDIHLDGTDEILIQRFMTTDPFARLRWYAKQEVEKMLQ